MTGKMNEQTQDFIRTHRHEDVRKLALKRPPEGVNLHEALQQIEGRQTAGKKLPSWAALDGIWFPPRLSMEQCSSEQTATYKRGLVHRLLPAAGNGTDSTMMDLTGGFGIDFSFLAVLFSRAVYMERQPELCRIARHNFSVLGLAQAEVHEVDSSANPQDWPEADLCFVDPARRDTVGRKTVSVEDCTPDLTLLQHDMRRKARYSLVKLSPMLDIQAALRSLQGISEVHAVCVQRECKELLCVMPQDKTEQVVFHCVNIGKDGRTEDFAFTADEEKTASCRYASEPGCYLYEPNAAILKCGGFNCLSERYGISKLHPNSHLYTSDMPCEDFPGRMFRVDSVSGFGKKEITTLLHGISQANLTVRNFPATVAELRKRLRLKEGGDTYLFATTLHDGHHVMIRCRKEP